MATRSKQLWWFCVEKDRNGELTAFKTHKVPDGEEDLKGFVYVQAYDREGAVTKALREYARVKSKKRKDLLRSKGLCTCGNKRDTPGFKTCSVCRERMKEYRGNARYRNRGVEIPDGRSSVQKSDRASVRYRDRDNEMRLKVFIHLRSAIEDESLSTLAQVKSYISKEILEMRKPRIKSSEVEKAS